MHIALLRASQEKLLVRRARGLRCAPLIHARPTLLKRWWGGWGDGASVWEGVGWGVEGGTWEEAKRLPTCDRSEPSSAVRASRRSLPSTTAMSARSRLASGAGSRGSYTGLPSLSVGAPCFGQNPAERQAVESPQSQQPPDWTIRYSWPWGRRKRGWEGWGRVPIGGQGGGGRGGGRGGCGRPPAGAVSFTLWSPAKKHAAHSAEVGSTSQTRQR